MPYSLPFAPMDKKSVVPRCDCDQDNLTTFPALSPQMSNFVGDSPKEDEFPRPFHRLLSSTLKIGYTHSFCSPSDSRFSRSFPSLPHTLHHPARYSDDIFHGKSVGPFGWHFRRVLDRSYRRLRQPVRLAASLCAYLEGARRVPAGYMLPKHPA